MGSFIPVGGFSDPNQQGLPQLPDTSQMSPDVELYLTRNMKALGQQNLASTASTTFDLASANQSVLDTLNQTTGATPPASQPSLMGSVFSHVFQQQGHLVPIADMQAYQQRLSNLGYMPPGYQPSGQYDAQTAQAHQMLGNDVAQQLRHGAGSIGTVGQGLSLLFNSSMPSHIAQGIGGFFKNLVTSAFGTAKRLAGLVAAPLEHESYGAAFKDFYHHLGEDTLNVLSVVGMFTGASELFDAGRAGLGMVGALGESGADAAARFIGKEGFDEVGLKAATRLPDVEAMMNEPSHLTRLAQWGLKHVPGVGGEMSDGFLRIASTYGPGRLAEMPIMKAAGEGLSGAAHMAFIPQVAAVFDPNGPLGKATRSVKPLPWWTDLPTFVIHPTNGTVLKPKNVMSAFRISGFGHLDPLRGLLDNVPDNIRTLINAQAYLKQQAREALGQTTSGLAKLEEGERSSQYAEALSKVTRDALIDPETPSRGLNPDIQQKANEWADAHTYKVRRHVMDFVNSAGYREERGMIGMNPLEDWLGATNAANDLTVKMHQAMPAYQAAAAKAQAARDKFDSLDAAFQTGMLGGRSPAQWQQDIADAAKEASDTKAEAQRLHPFNAVGGNPNSPAMHILNNDDPLKRRILIMRADNPRERQALYSLERQWDTADAAGREQLRPQLQKLFLDGLPDDRVGDNLSKLAKHAATDITDHLPADIQNEFRSRGYKAVLGGSDVLLPSDIDPSAVSSTKYSRSAYWAANFGASPIAQDPKDIEELVSAARRRGAADYAFGQGQPHDVGERIVAEAEQARAQRLRDLASATGTTRTERFMARAQASLALREIQLPEITKAVQNVTGMDEMTAKKFAFGIQHSMRVAQASPDMLTGPNDTFRVLHRVASAMRVHGLQGIPELMRSIQIGKDGGWTVTHLPAVAHLPANLMKATMALRFSLNPMFDARRAVKTPFFGLTSEDLPYDLFPKRTLTKIGVTAGGDATAGSKFGNMLLEGAKPGLNAKMLDDLDEQALSQGVFGYNLQNHEKLQALRLHQREYVKAGGSIDEWKQAVARGSFKGLNPEAHATAMKYLQDDPKHTLGGLYGPRSPLEKSANAIFFPFSFQKKLLGQTADWLTHEPVRVFLAHAMMQQFNQFDKLGPDHQTRIGRIINKYIPIFNDVAKLNAFSEGISPGEFGGVYAPMAKTLGVPVQAVFGAFHPMGVTSGSAAQFQKLLPRVAPGWQEVSNAMKDAIDQMQVVTSAPHESHQGQLTDYFALKRAIEDEKGNIATAFGVSATTLSRSSDPVLQQLDQQFKAEQAALDTKYPWAANYAITKYGANTEINDEHILQILAKVHKSPLDEAVVAMETLRNELGNLPTANDGNPGSALLQKQLENEQMRAEGLRLFEKLGEQWNQLWKVLGYEHTYGPVSEHIV